VLKKINVNPPNNNLKTPVKEKKDKSSSDSSTEEDVAQIFPNSILENPPATEQSGALFAKIKYLEQENRNITAEVVSLRKQVQIAQNIYSTLSKIAENQTDDIAKEVFKLREN
jgi:hypothetical protein